MLGRLLERLEQSVECADREHVHLVNDEHALFDLCGGIARLIAQVTDIVHTIVGSRIDLGHIEHRAVQYAAARRTLVARVAVHRVLAVDRARQDLGAGGLARAARAGEQVGMAQPPGLELRAQGIRDMLLADHVRERLRPPLAV